MRQTSLDTYQQILDEGLLPPKRLEVYQYVVKHGPCTAGQIKHGLRDHNAHKRTSELERQGMLRERGEVTCPITGRPAIVWEANLSLPRPLTEGAKTVVTRRQLIRQIAELNEEIERLRTQVAILKLRLED